MARSGRFRAASLGEPWQGYRRLAEEMERSRLTVREAHALLLYTRGMDYPGIRKALALESRQSAYRAVRRAVARLVRNRPGLAEVRQRWVRELLSLLHNPKTRKGKRPPPVYDTLGRVVTFRAVRFTADDLAVWKGEIGAEYLQAPDLDLFVTLLERLHTVSDAGRADPEAPTGEPG